MYIKWHKRRTPHGTPMIDAVAVRAARIEGKPRPQQVGHLASYNPARIDDPRTRERFWRHVVFGLSRHSAAIGPDDRARLVDLIARLIPRTGPEPDPSELARLEAVVRAARGRV